MVAVSFFAALAAAAVVSGQSDQCSQSTLTINSAQDATNIDCTTFTGNIVVGNSTGSEISFPSKLTKIQGDLVVVGNKNIVTLGGAELITITGTMRVEQNEQLSSIAFPKLKSVKEISWITLSSLQSLGTAITSAQKVTISDTRLISLKGLDLITVDTISINGNSRLTQVPTKLTSVSTQFVSDNNGQEGNGCSFEFPDLLWARNLILNNASALIAPKLSNVNESLYFNFAFTDSVSLPNLSSVGATFSFANNKALTNLSAPALTSIGGDLTIANNTALQKVDGLPSLKSIGGAVLMRGNFNSVSLPALDNVKGVFDTQSTTDIKSSCDVFTKQGSSGQIQGKVVCASDNADANNVNSSKNGTSGGSGSAASGLSLNKALLGLALVGGFIALF